MWKPKYFHEMMKNRAVSTVLRVGEPRLVELAQADRGQDVVSRPLGWRIRLQTTPVTTSDDDVRGEEDQAQDRPAAVESLVKSLTAVYHGRVKYPDQRTA